MNNLSKCIAAGLLTVIVGSIVPISAQAGEGVKKWPASVFCF